MLKRIKLGIGAAAGVAALALGGAALAGATQSAPIKAPVPAAAQEVKAPDTDNVQSGDQTTPDSPATAARAHSSSTSPAGNEAPGNENAPEATGKAAEAPSNENAPSDGPGGHADPPGNVDNQQQGQN